MNTDEKIRAILRMEADAVEPSAAGYDAIKTGIAARRRRTWWVRGSAFAGTVVATVAALVVMAADPAPQTIRPAPSTSVGTDPTPSPTATPSPTPTATVAAPPDTAALGTIWPLTTYGELRAWKKDNATYPSLATPRGSALAFARSYLLISDAEVVEQAPYWLVKRPGGVYVTKLSMRAYGEGTTAPYLVTFAESDAFRIDSPSSEATVDSPLVVQGTYDAVDPSLTVRLRGDGAGSAPVEYGDRRAELSAPNTWRTELAYSPTTSVGAVMVTLGSLRDEGIAAAAVVPVRFAPASAAGAETYVGVRGDEVALFDARNGAYLRPLNHPQEGQPDYAPDLSPDGSRVLWAGSIKACSTGVTVLPVAGGTGGGFATEYGVITLPRFAGNGAVAYVQNGCGDGAKPQLRLHDLATDTDRLLRTLDGDPSALAASPDGRHLVYLVGTTLTWLDVRAGTVTNVPPTQECEWRAVDVVGTSSAGRPILLGLETCMDSGYVSLYRFAVGAPDHDLVAELLRDASYYRVEHDPASGATLVTHGVEDGPSWIEKLARDGKRTRAGQNVNDASW
ncbi:MAG TPA: hypothetical protein VGX28_16500 [Frankiaceae bacterium]|jgi:hypothetical protein|nr:hypothetical protein [Frankiaceae bacterium]